MTCAPGPMTHAPCCFAGKLMRESKHMNPRTTRAYVKTHYNYAIEWLRPSVGATVDRFLENLRKRGIPIAGPAAAGPSNAPAPAPVP